jgi:hypothetical protein
MRGTGSASPASPKSAGWAPRSHLAAWALRECLRLLLKWPAAIQDPMAAGRLLRGPRSTRAARSHPASQDRRDLVSARDPARPHRRRQQRQHRGHQPSYQADQAGRRRVQITSQLSAPHPQPHRGHSIAKISSMNRSNPLNSKSRESLPGKRRAPLSRQNRAFSRQNPVDRWVTGF